MMGTDRDALICDLAETYQIYSFEAVPLLTLATLAAGLHADSRIRMKMDGAKRIAPFFLWVEIADTLNALTHALVGKKGSTAPTRYRDIMMGEQDMKEKATGFESPEDFEAARKRIING